jgi:hypothetical protein
MSGWRHRVIRDDTGTHRIAEVYDIDGDTMWTTAPVAPVSDTLDGLEVTLRRMLRALEEPVLEESEMRRDRAV